METISIIWILSSLGIAAESMILVMCRWFQDAVFGRIFLMGMAISTGWPAIAEIVRYIEGEEIYHPVTPVVATYLSILGFLSWRLIRARIDRVNAPKDLTQDRRRRDPPRAYLRRPKQENLL